MPTSTTKGLMMMPVSGPRSSTVQLPNDVLAIIVSHLDRISLKRVRLCSRWFAREAARHLFFRVSFCMRAESLERVIGIVNSSMISDAVKVLRLQETPKLPKFNNFEDWCRSIRKDMYSSSDEEREIEDNDQVGNPQGEEPLRSWDARHPDFPERKKQFREYKAQRNEPSLYDCLHAPGPSVSEGALTVLQNQGTSTGRLGTATEDLRRFQKACVGFEEALLRLHNLQRLEAVFSYEDASWWPWRNHELNITSTNFRMQDAASEDIDHLAFMLRALGKRNASNKSLTSLRLTIDSYEPATWNLQDLKYAWMPPEEDDEGEEDERDLSRLSQVILATSLILMDDAFAYLTDIRITFDADMEWPEFMEGLARSLHKASGLIHLQLVLGDEKSESDTDDMLTEINNYASWPKIADLCLTRFTFSETSIIRMLSLAATSLRSLTLRNCELLGEDSSWWHCYERMRLIPFQVLDDLDFRKSWQHSYDRESLHAPRQDWSSKDVVSRSLVTHSLRGFIR